MENSIFLLTSDQTVSRMVYLKTAVIVLGIMLIIHLSGQWRTPPLIDAKISLVICTVLGLLLLYGLTRTPYTKSLSIDYDRRKVVISYMTLMKLDNTLEITFAQLSTQMDTSFGVTGYGTKWKIYLLSNQKQVYNLSSRELGFSEEQMNQFVEKIKKCQ